VNLAGLAEAIGREFQVTVDPKAWLEADHEIAESGLRDRVVEAVEGAYQQKVEQVGAPVMRHLEKAVMLQELDRHWREHLAAMDYLRQGIHLRAYAQKNPQYGRLNCSARCSTASSTTRSRCCRACRCGRRRRSKSRSASANGRWLASCRHSTSPQPSFRERNGRPGGRRRIAVRWMAPPRPRSHHAGRARAARSVATSRVRVIRKK
jgi:hypothetical protein